MPFSFLNFFVDFIIGFLIFLVGFFAGRVFQNRIEGDILDNIIEEELKTLEQEVRMLKELVKGSKEDS